MTNGMYGINPTGRDYENGVVGPTPALGLPNRFISYHRALHDVTDRHSFGAVLNVARTDDEGLSE
ncbi:MAG: hypothetical protein U5K35_02355 [Rhodohalobacter sp.]|nr:hypothetical protein [Rhodohalobacter sp.]